MTNTTIRHGTTSGYYRHKRLEEDPCRECKDAINRYIAEYRDRPDHVRNKAREGARRKATALLRQRHREEYEKLIEDFYVDAMI
jgi:hypothetical protein